MLSNKPYLVRAFYDWIVDSHCTPLLVLNAKTARCTVPDDYIDQGQITLNISPQAVRDLNITSNFIEFRASFSGVVYTINAPLHSILSIYAQENNQGMFFDEEVDETGFLEEELVEETESGSGSQSGEGTGSKSGASHLRVIK